jgi:hypothetical protein
MNETNNQELGYQYLDTSFTGTKAPQLSGSFDPELEGFILPCDSGTAHNLSDVESKSYF